MSQKVIGYGTRTCLLSSVLMPVIGFMLFADNLDTKEDHTLSCHWLVVTTSVLYLTAKYAMYFVFAARIESSFSSSARYAYRKRTMRCLYASLMIVFLFGLVANAGVGSGERRKQDYNRNGVKVDKSKRRALSRCLFAQDSELLAMMPVFDLMFSSIMLVMFVRPLRKIMAEMDDDPDSSRLGASLTENELRVVPLKYGVVCAVAMFSTSFTILLMIAGFQLAVMIDVCVNATSLVIITKHFKKPFWRLCTPLMKCVVSCRCCCTSSRSIAIEAAVEYVSGYYCNL